MMMTMLMMLMMLTMLMMTMLMMTMLMMTMLMIIFERALYILSGGGVTMLKIRSKLFTIETSLI